MIKPTVGRIVWFWQSAPMSEHVQPFAAIIARVWGDNCVNLAIFNDSGNPVASPPTSVRLLAEGESAPKTGCYATWMPYQLAKS